MALAVTLRDAPALVVRTMSTLTALHRRLNAATSTSRRKASRLHATARRIIVRKTIVRALRMEQDVILSATAKIVRTSTTQMIDNDIGEWLSESARSCIAKGILGKSNTLFIIIIIYFSN